MYCDIVKDDGRAGGLITLDWVLRRKRKVANRCCVALLHALLHEYCFWVFLRKTREKVWFMIPWLGVLAGDEAGRR